LYCIVIL